MTRLNPSERRWLEQTRHDPDGAPPARHVAPRLHRACSVYLEQSGRVAAALVSGTATNPPQSGARPERRGGGHSDPVAAQLAATHDLLARSARLYAHLLVGCHHDEHDPQRPPGCPPWRPGHLDSLVDVADAYTAPDDHRDITVALHVLQPTVTGRFADAVTEVARRQALTVRALSEGWDQARRAGSDGDRLTAHADRVTALATRMRSLAGRLAQWTPPAARRCQAGCGAAVPDLAVDATPRGGATCDRCLKRRSRARTHTA